MDVDRVRGLTTYIVAAVVVIVGLLSIIALTAIGVFPADAGLPAITAIIGGAAGFLWGAETAKQAAKQAKNDLLAQPPTPPNP